MRFRILLCALALLAACKHDSNQGARISTPGLGIDLPALAGWSADPGVAPTDPLRGGIVLRLIHDKGVSGGPRIDVVAQPQQIQGARLEDFLTQNLRDMAALEESGTIAIRSVEQKAIKIGPRKGYQVRHEYVTQGTSPVSITQSARLFVLNGRGIAVTAAARTELFHQVADDIERILSDIQTPVDTPVTAQESPEPVDLGDVGGRK